jgi:hypothetical protein
MSRCRGTPTPGTSTARRPPPGSTPPPNPSTGSSGSSPACASSSSTVSTPPGLAVVHPQVPEGGHPDLQVIKTYHTSCQALWHRDLAERARRLTKLRVDLAYVAALLPVDNLRHSELPRAERVRSPAIPHIWARLCGGQSRRPCHGRRRRRLRRIAPRDVEARSARGHAPRLREVQDKGHYPAPVITAW